MKENQSKSIGQGEDLAFKKEFLLINFKNTQDIRSQHVEFLHKIKTWYITVWIASLSFMVKSDFDVKEMYIILFSISLSFWIVNLNWKYRKEDVSRIIRQFEKYLMNVNDKEISEMTGPLLSIYIPPTSKDKWQLFFKSVSSWHDNDIYFFTALLSSFLPLFLSK
jgi:RNA recognition motif-containing protein